MKTDKLTLEKIKQLHAHYISEIEGSYLSPLAAKIYKVNSENFIRWIQGEFNPGERSRRVKSKKYMSERAKN